MADQPDSRILELKTAFREGTEPDIDVRVTMLNINKGRNAELLQSCRPLAEYSQFIGDVRHYEQKLHDMDSAIIRAVESLPEDSVIKEFLLANIAEVKEMCITEYDEEAERKFLRKEGREEGLAEGRKLEAERMGALIRRLISENRLSDLERASADSDYKESLYRKYNL